MTAEELRQAGIELFGEERGWMARFAKALKTGQDNLSRWLSGTIPVPGPVEAAVECWLKVARKTAKKRKPK